LPGRNANAYSDPHAFTYRNNYTDSDCDCNGYGYGYGYGNSHHHTNSISYAYAHADAAADPHPASADAKAAANPVPASDAVSEWARRLKELQSKRELARPCPDRYAKRCRCGDSRVPCFAVDRLLLKCQSGSDRW
jgi:hypothetical protein